MANDWDLVIKDLNDIRRNELLIKRSLSTVLAHQRKRIFIDGRDARGNRIGSYSTKKISISRKNQARRTGKTTFQGGYAEYKRLIGKNPGYVNLRNTDQMMVDYGLEDLGKDTYGFGFSRNENYDKSQFSESKFKKEIFDESDNEGRILEDLLVKGI